MANLTSTLDIRLVDDVTKNASQIDAALQKMAGEAKAVDQALSRGGASDKFAAGLKRIGASVPAIEGATKAMRAYAEAEGLAANRGDWTKSQTTAFRNMESVTISGVRAIMGAERALEEQRARASAHHREQMLAETRAAERQAAMAHRMKGHDGHFDQSTLGGTLATAGAFGFEHMMHSVLERYRDFDKERRYAKVVMGLTDEQQEPLVKQALTGGATSRFNDIQWLEAQREFASRGYGIDQVKAFTPIAADVGTAFDQTLPESVKAIEGAMLGFGKDTSTFERAVASARRTADLEVKTSKISGMSFEDITQLYKYGAAPAKQAGLTEEQMLAFGAVLKKNNMGGDEAGVAFRALAANLVKPTAGAVTAMRANGIDFSSYQQARPMDVAGFTSIVAQRYGVQLDAAAQAGIARIFTDKGIIGDASKFTPAVVQFLQGALGGKDAKSLKSIAGLAKDYRNASLGGVDTVRLLTDMMQALSKNKGLANALFGSKQGGRIFAALGDPEVFNNLLEQIHNHSAGFAGDVAAARNEGFNGQMAQLGGAIATLESSIGRAFDNGGSGGPLTQAATAARSFVQSLSEMNPTALRAGVEAAAAAAVIAGLKSIDFIKGGFGLKAAGAEMTSAGEMQLQAGRLMLEAAAGGKMLPHALEGSPGAKPGDDPAMRGVKPNGEAGLYGGGPKVDISPPKSGGINPFGAGGIKGLAAGAAEGVVGAIMLSAGQEGIHYLEDRFLGWKPEDHARVDAANPWAGDGERVAGWMKALDAWAGKMGGLVTDKTSGPDPYLSGERAGIDERARRSADAFRRDPEAERGERMRQAFAPVPETPSFYRDPEAARGNAMMQNFGPAPVIDTSSLDTVKAKAGEAHAAIDGLNVTANPQVSAGSIDAYLGKLREAIALQSQLGTIGAGPNASISPRRSFQRSPMGATTT